MKRAYADIPEGQVHYRTEGSGEPLLLLHSWPSSSAEYAGMIPVLAKNYWVVAMDTLGYGSSDDPPREYEIADYARSVVSFLDALGIKKTSIVGHHTGSAIAVEVAAAYPERVNKLILAGCPTFDPAEWEPYKKSIGHPPIRGLITDEKSLVESYHSIEKMVPDISPQGKLRSLIVRATAYMKPYDSHPPLERYEIKQRLPLIKCPTLLVFGTKDDLFYLMERTKKLVPRSKTLVVQDAGLSGVSDKPNEIARATLDFLKNPGT